MQAITGLISPLRKKQPYKLELEGIVISVTFKPVKRINLVVSAPQGTVRISAPLKISKAEIRKFAFERIDWIRRHVAELQECPTTLKDGHPYPVWGRLCKLNVHPGSERPRIELREEELHIYGVQCEKPEGLESLLSGWRQALVTEAARPLIKKWHKLAGAPEADLCVRRMKTRWGSCSPQKGRITLNSELACKSPDLLEYVVVHELAHFRHQNHGPGFRACMDALMPDWRQKRKRLNEGN